MSIISLLSYCPKWNKGFFYPDEHKQNNSFLLIVLCTIFCLFRSDPLHKGSTHFHLNKLKEIHKVYMVHYSYDKEKHLWVRASPVEVLSIIKMASKGLLLVWHKIQIKKNTFGGNHLPNLREEDYNYFYYKYMHVKQSDKSIWSEHSEVNTTELAN